MSSSTSFALTWQDEPPGTLPTALTSPIAWGLLWQATQDEFLLNVPGQARILVTRGQSIHIERAASTAPTTNSTTEQALRFFLQGLPFAAYVVQRGGLALHATAVATPQGAIVLAGFSASGKSTLAAALAQQGYAVLADEVTPLCITENGLQVAPALNTLYLWRYAIEGLGLDLAACTPARPGLERYAPPPFPAAPADAPQTEFPQAVRAIYLLKTYNHPTVQHEPISGHARFMALQHYVINRTLAQPVVRNQQQFFQLSRLLATTQIFYLRRPRTGWYVPDLVTTILTTSGITRDNASEDGADQ